jgi:NitT/TauT family transport system substrate-binding protein
MTPLRLRLLWKRQAQFAGWLLAERLGLARERGLDLLCEEPDFAVPPVEAVLQGLADACIASPSHLLESREPRALRFVLAIQQASPLAYPVRRGEGMRGAADLAGRRVAVWPGGEDLELRWMLRRAGIEPEQVERVPAADTTALFRAGEVASCQVTTYHELHALAGQDIDILRAADLGADLLKDGLIVPAVMPAGTVQTLVEAGLTGWTQAFADPELAVRVCAHTRPDMSAAEHRRQLADIRILVAHGATRTYGLGYPDPAHMERAARAMRELGEPAPPDPLALVDTGYWQAAPAALRAPWP